MAAVMAVMGLLLTAGLRGLGDPAAQARKAATESVMSLVEQARTTAITSRCVVVLALADPGDLPSGEACAHIGLFKIKQWPAAPGVLDGTLIRRWQALPGGAIIFPGAVNGVRNPRDEPERTIRYLSGKRPCQGDFHLIAFTARGGLLWPAGSDPVALRIAEGGYRHGQPSPNIRDGARGIAENRVKIGRITARPYQF